MEEIDLIYKISRMSGEKNIELIQDYIEVSKEIILARAFPFADTYEMTVPLKYQMLQAEIVVELLMKRGAEGETANSQGGVSRTYENSYVSERLLSRILPAPCVFNVGGGSNETSKT